VTSGRVVGSVLDVRLAARPPQRVLALQVELCSPRLIALRVEAHWRASGFRPGLWPQGQSKRVYSSEPPVDRFRAYLRAREGMSCFARTQTAGKGGLERDPG